VSWTFCTPGTVLAASVWRSDITTRRTGSCSSAARCARPWPDRPARRRRRDALAIVRTVLLRFRTDRRPFGPRAGYDDRRRTANESVRWGGDRRGRDEALRRGLDGNSTRPT
jgi:hypothetical protein